MTKRNPHEFYQFDIARLAGRPGLDEHGEDYDIRLHHSTFYDEDEDRAGELYDPGTGRRYDNSSYTGAENLDEVDPEVFDADPEAILKLAVAAGELSLKEPEEVVAPRPRDERPSIAS